ncbi:hypothetical protein EDC01DRAFT_748679 [Geopyxis carbonaria]|nr:hypothetical protein EDC01DRAFT_748679 [Geopyxis carbonaria]
MHLHARARLKTLRFVLTSILSIPIFTPTPTPSPPPLPAFSTLATLATLHLPTTSEPPVITLSSRDASKTVYTITSGPTSAFLTLYAAADHYRVANLAATHSFLHTHVPAVPSAQLYGYNTSTTHLGGYAWLLTAPPPPALSSASELAARSRALAAVLRGAQAIGGVYHCSDLPRDGEGWELTPDGEFCYGPLTHAALRRLPAEERGPVVEWFAWADMYTSAAAAGLREEAAAARWEDAVVIEERWTVVAAFERATGELFSFESDAENYRLGLHMDEGGAAWVGPEWVGGREYPAALAEEEKAGKAGEAGEEEKEREREREVFRRESGRWEEGEEAWDDQRTWLRLVMGFEGEYGEAWEWLGERERQEEDGEEE